MSDAYKEHLSNSPQKSALICHIQVIDLSFLSTPSMGSNLYPDMNEALAGPMMNRRLFTHDGFGPGQLGGGLADHLQPFDQVSQVSGQACVCQRAVVRE